VNPTGILKKTGWKTVFFLYWVMSADPTSGLFASQSILHSVGSLELPFQFSCRSL